MLSRLTRRHEHCCVADDGDEEDPGEFVDHLAAEEQEGDAELGQIVERLCVMDEAEATRLIEAAPFPMWYRGPDLKLGLVNSAFVDAVEGRDAADVAERIAKQLADEVWVVAPEHEWELAGASRRADKLCHLVAQLEDLREIASVLVATGAVGVLVAPPTVGVAASSTRV